VGWFVHLIFRLGSVIGEGCCFYRSVFGFCIVARGKGRVEVGLLVLAKQKECLDGAVIAAMKATLVNIDEAKGVLLGDFAEGFDQAIDSGVFGGRGGFHCGVFRCGQGLVEQPVLDAPGALHSPLGCAHFLDESQFNPVDGLKGGYVLVDQCEEAFRAFHVGDDDLTESMTDGVLGGTAFAFLCDGAFGQGTVEAGTNFSTDRGHFQSPDLTVQEGFLSLLREC